MSFDRGYISHHMVTDLEAMRAVVQNPYIVLTDIKMKTAEPAGRRQGASPPRTIARW